MIALQWPFSEPVCNLMIISFCKRSISNDQNTLVGRKTGKFHNFIVVDDKTCICSKIIERVESQYKM